VPDRSAATCQETEGAPLVACGFYDCPVKRYDAIVVGAGPAGSATAYRLAQAGASVLLLDRARFPRDKPCGGGLTWRAVRELPYSVDPVVEDVVDRFEFELDYRHRFERRSPAPLVLMTQRRLLDAFLAEQAAAVGAEFRDGTKVESVEVDSTAARVTVGSDTVATEVVVGADGANGVTARAIGLGSDHEYGVALEGNVPYEHVRRPRYAGRAVVELGTVPGGYAWVFPKGDHVNVGVGGWKSEGPRLRAHLARLCAERKIPEERVEELRGHRLPMRGAGAKLAQGRALLVGDAAGLVDPLSGDGMYEAFVSARLASESVLDLLSGRASSLQQYGTTLTRALAPLTSASWGVKLAFDRFPKLSYAVARAPLVWGVVDGLLRGDLGHPSAARGVVRGPLKLLEGLARAAGDPGRPFRESRSSAQVAKPS
jgi:geranylgeranyl reductase family protein